MDQNDKSIRVGVVQCFLTEYRVPIFKKLSEIPGLEFKFYFGDVKHRKYRKYTSVDDAGGISHFRLRTIPVIFRIRGRIFSSFIHPALPIRILLDRPQVLIVEGESNILNNMIVLPLCRLMGIPYVWWGLGRFRKEPMSLFRKLLRPVIRYMISKSSAVIGYSRFAREFYISEGADPDRTFVAHNVLDTDSVFESIEKFSPMVEEEKKNIGLAGKTTLVFVGALERTKRLENAFLAFSSLKKKHPELAFLIVGDGEEKPLLESYVTDKHLEDVVFTGKRFADVSKYMLMGDVFVLPGLGGLHICHAMCHGLPVVASHADGTEEDLIRNGLNGYIVPRDNIAELENAIEMIISQPGKSERMGKESRRIIEEQYNITAMIKVFEDVICMLTEINK